MEPNDLGHELHPESFGARGAMSCRGMGHLVRGAGRGRGAWARGDGAGRAQGERRANNISGTTAHRPLGVCVSMEWHSCACLTWLAHLAPVIERLELADTA